MTKAQFFAHSDSYIDLLRDIADVQLTAEREGLALTTWHEPSVGIFGGPVTPWFETEAELEAYCKDVIFDRIPRANLDEYLIVCLDLIEADWIEADI